MYVYGDMVYLLFKNRKIQKKISNLNLAHQKYNLWWPSELPSKKVIRLSDWQTF